MNIKKALKRKNKLLNEIKTEFSKVTRYNSITEGTPRPYSVKESMDNWKKLIDELIELKTKIHVANAPIYDKIFRLSELKSMVESLKGLDCTEGVPLRGRYDTGDQPPRTTEIGIKENDELISQLENEIDEIQEFLDEWNFKTNI
jgi:hypothetical protein